MIIIGEVRISGMNHVAVNVALLKMVRMIFPNKQILFYGERESISYIKKWDNQILNISFINIPYIKHNKLTFIFREMLMFFQIIYLHWICKKKSSNLLFLLSISPFSQYLLELFKPIFFRSINTLIILHELDWITAKRYSLHSIHGYFINKSINTKNRKNLKYLVLGEIIKENLIRINPQIKEDDFLWIDLPYIYKSINKKDIISECIKFASIGFADIKRNVHKIFEIALNFSNEIYLKKINFEIIGQIHPSVYKYANDMVLYSKTLNKVPQMVYEKKIREVDYALFFRTDHGLENTFNYSLRASGALFDAIKFEKPIIAIRNDYFEYYFKRFGNIGYLCKDINEMTEIIQFIISQRTENDYQIQIANLKKAKDELSIDNIQLNLRKQLESWIL